MKSDKRACALVRSSCEETRTHKFPEFLPLLLLLLSLSGLMKLSLRRGFVSFFRRAPAAFVRPNSTSSVAAFAPWIARFVAPGVRGGVFCATREFSRLFRSIGIFYKYLSGRWSWRAPLRVGDGHFARPVWAVKVGFLD